MRIQTGFTLVELLIAMLLGGLLLAFGLPVFDRFMDRSTLSSEVNNWVAVLNIARSEAITRGERVTVCRTVNPDACDGTANCNCGVTESGGSSPPNYHTGYLVFTSEGNTQPLNFRPGSGNQLIRTGRALSNKVTIQGNGQANNAFSFAPDGALATEDVSTSLPQVTARHIICLSDVVGDDDTAESTTQVPGRVAIISAIGRPRVMAFEVGGACVDGDSSNLAADSSVDYGN